jgi:hypothetical protein
MNTHPAEPLRRLHAMACLLHDKALTAHAAGDPSQTLETVAAIARVKASFRQRLAQIDNTLSSRPSLS